MYWNDWLLLACAACLVAVGPAMALQEAAKAQDAQAEYDRTGVASAPSTGFREVWRLPMATLVLLVGILGTVRAVRALIDPGVRSVARRLMALLLAGLGVLYVAYYADGALFQATPYLVRGVTIVWMYPIAGILVGGSTHRLAELEDHFARGPDGDLDFRI